MPCWFYDKKDLINTPSLRDGISAETEAFLRKEGAKYIIEAGNKLGLRFDTCATGVVYFHRFYMFHSFKEFNRLVTAACCLFLAGKVEETPKKCKDIIKTFRMMLNDAEFAAFGEDPKEEVMTLERILLQTIKFDLMVEHPYAFLLKYAKLVKGDKAKIQKLVQMAWTFINDSLCTTLCLQWEPEIVAVAVMYLTSRLTKFEIVDWQGKPPSYRGKWYEFLVDDVTLELLEDICHQVLDLYSNTPGSQPKDVTGSPAPAKSRHLVQSSDDDQSRTPKTPKSPHAVKRPAPSSAAGSSSSQAVDSDVNPPVAKQREQVHGESAPSALHSQYASGAHSSHQPAAVTSHAAAAASQAAAAAAAAGAGAGTSAVPTSSSFTSANPYMSTQMYSSSFMSTEGSQSIQSLMGVQGQASAAGQVPGHGYQGTPSASGAASRSEYSGTAPSSGYPAAAAGYQQTVSMSAPVAPPFAGYQQNAAGAGASVPPPYGHGYKQSQYPSATEQSTLPDYATYGAGGQSTSTYASENQPVAGQRYQSASQPVYHGQSTGSYQNQQSAGVSGYQSYQAPVASDQTYHGQSTAAAGGFQSHELARERFPGRDRPQNAGGFHGQHGSANYHHGNVQGFSGRSGAGTGYSQQQPDYHQQTHSGQAPSGGAASHGQNWGY